MSGFSKSVNKLESRVEDDEFNNFLNSFDEYVEEKKESNLFAVIFGASGAGKSYVCGTLPGKTLFLNVSLESHGVDSARTCAKKKENGAKIAGISFDSDGDPDEAYTDLLNKLSFIAENPSVDTVVIDSINMIETGILRRTKRFFKECMTSKGEHNSFQEGPAVSNMFFEIFTALEKIKKSGVNVIATCALQINALNADGSIASAKPHLSTFQVAETIARIFPTVLVIGRVGGEHLFQFKADIKKDSKDKDTKKVLKTENFSPRVQQFDTDELPEMAVADLNKILERIRNK